MAGADRAESHSAAQGHRVSETRVRFDWSINLGHVLTALTFLVSTMAAWFSLNSRVDMAAQAIVRPERIIDGKAEKEVVTKGELELSRRVVESQANQNTALIRIDEGFKEIKGALRDIDQKLDRKGMSYTEAEYKAAADTYGVPVPSSNVVPLGGGAAGTAILSATAGRWARLKSDGTNWVIMQGVI